jgi:hypothetical protein
MAIQSSGFIRMPLIGFSLFGPLFSRRPVAATLTVMAMAVPWSQPDIYIYITPKLEKFYVGL